MPFVNCWNVFIYAMSNVMILIYFVLLSYAELHISTLAICKFTV